MFVPEVYRPKIIHKVMNEETGLNNPSNILCAEASFCFKKNLKGGACISFNCSQCAVRRPARGLDDLQARELNSDTCLIL